MRVLLRGRHVAGRVWSNDSYRTEGRQRDGFKRCNKEVVKSKPLPVITGYKTLDYVHAITDEGSSRGWEGAGQ